MNPVHFAVFVLQTISKWKPSTATVRPLYHFIQQHCGWMTWIRERWDLDLQWQLSDSQDMLTSCASTSHRDQNRRLLTICCTNRKALFTWAKKHKTSNKLRVTLNVESFPGAAETQRCSDMCRRVFQSWCRWQQVVYLCQDNRTVFVPGGAEAGLPEPQWDIQHHANPSVTATNDHNHRHNNISAGILRRSNAS